MAYMQSPDFFHYIEDHRGSLLKAIQRRQRQNPEVKKEIQEPVTSSQVVAAIDKIVQEVLESLSKDEAPVLTMEDRSNWTNIEFTESVGLQMVKNCTTRKVRSDNPRSAQRFGESPLAHTSGLLSAYIRDIYYEDVQLYGSQRTVDSIVMDISCMLKIPRRSLHILSTSKGCVAGSLLYIEQDGTKVDCSFNTSVRTSHNLRTAARYILIIEKDATFQRLLDDDFCGKCGPCILITGKGVPDVNTRLFVRKLWDTFQIPIFTLVDADPHGMLTISDSG
ncbi:hypothetical protein GDO78_004785 [Eleutherodactylus coqui]|uniref:DNA topoisomerase (ATP-hydrolyzing) n=1 Tax=Eleutherodactylus coqui TaxID=57060 RepID=A0A8J6ERT7_ELECQ|nr:hypothetical protein GDO78_004785 [Eleutherodactylus coqui]